MDLIAFHVWKFIVITKLCWRSRDLTGYLCRRERPFLEWILIMLLMLNLLVVCNKLVSSFWLMLSYGFWHFHHPNLLASSVLCIALSHIEDCAYFASTSKPREMICSLTHKPHYIFLKTATIPTYYSISIAVPRYIAMQHPSFIMSYHVIKRESCFMLHCYIVILLH